MKETLLKQSPAGLVKLSRFDYERPDGSGTSTTYFVDYREKTLPAQFSLAKAQLVFDLICGNDIDVAAIAALAKKEREARSYE